MERAELVQTPPESIQQRYEFMRDFLHEAGEYALQAFAHGYQLEIETKPDGSRVTNMDIEINQLFIDAVANEYGRDAVFGEELVNVPEDYQDQWRWIIDPIDGTGGFIRNTQNKTPDECTSAIMIAAFEPGATVPCMAGVYKPFGEIEEYTAHDYMVARQKAEPAAPVLSVDGMFPLVMVDTYDIDPWTGAQPDVRKIEPQLLDAKKIKISSIGVSAGRIATGALDLSVFPGPDSKPHDYTPAMYLANRLAPGSWVTNLDGDLMEDIDMRETTNGLIMARSMNAGKQVLEIVQALPSDSQVK